MLHRISIHQSSIIAYPLWGCGGLFRANPTCTSYALLLQNRGWELKPIEQNCFAQLFLLSCNLRVFHLVFQCGAFLVCGWQTQLMTQEQNIMVSIPNCVPECAPREKTHPLNQSQFGQTDWSRRLWQFWQLANKPLSWSDHLPYTFRRNHESSIVFQSKQVVALIKWCRYSLCHQASMAHITGQLVCRMTNPDMYTRALSTRLPKQAAR